MNHSTLTRIRNRIPNLGDREASYLYPAIFFEHAQGILGVNDRTMSQWFWGWESDGVLQAPLITEPEPDPEWVSWFGFLHAFLMLELGVDGCSDSDAMAVRRFFGLLASEFGLDCALGLEELWLPESFEAITRMQLEADLAEDFQMVSERADGVLVLSAGAQSLSDRLVFEYGCVRRMVLDYPVVDGDEPIYLDALKGHGAPIMRFVGIHHFRGFIEGGDTEEDLLEVYKDWGITLSELRHAVSYAQTHNVGHFDFDDKIEPDEVYYAGDGRVEICYLSEDHLSEDHVGRMV